MECTMETRIEVRQAPGASTDEKGDDRSCSKVPFYKQYHDAAKIVSTNPYRYRRRTLDHVDMSEHTDGSCDCDLVTESVGPLPSIITQPKSREHARGRFSAEYYRTISNSDSTILCGRSFLFPTNVEQRAFEVAVSGQEDDCYEDEVSMKKRIRVKRHLDRCEAVPFPFKKKLNLKNMNLGVENLPIADFCGTNLGQTLYKLSLSGNALCHIPQQLVTSLPSLKSLDLSRCNLHYLPSNWWLPELTRLDLSLNKLTEFPEESVLRGVPNLVELNLYGNKLTHLSVSGGNGKLLTQLKVLNVGYNDIIVITEDFQRLSSIKTLLLMNNFLQVVPRHVCERNLAMLDVSCNPIVQPPMEICERGFRCMRMYYRNQVQKPPCSVRQDMATVSLSDWGSNALLRPSSNKNGRKMKQRKNADFPETTSALSSVFWSRSRS